MLNLLPYIAVALTAILGYIAYLRRKITRTSRELEVTKAVVVDKKERVEKLENTAIVVEKEKREDEESTVVTADADAGLARLREAIPGIR